MATSIHTGTPRTWVAGEVVSAAQLNTEVRDAMLDLQDDWDAYASNWGITSGGTAPTLSNGTLTASWRAVGKTVWYRIALTIGSTSSLGSGGWTFLLPTTLSANYLAGAPIGDVSCVDLSAGPAVYPRAAMQYNSTRLQVYGPSNDRVNPTTPFAWATGDTLQVLGMYESA